MSDYRFTIFAPDNFDDLPYEDGTHRSSLSNGDSLTFQGGGERATVEIDDPDDDVFDESLSNQALAKDITFDGVSYSAGQVVTPTYIIEATGSDGGYYEVMSFNFSANTSGEVPDAATFLGATPPPGTTLMVTGERNSAYADSPQYERMAVCFGGDTRIAVPGGTRAADALGRGDRVALASGGSAAIRWIARRRLDFGMLARAPGLAPVRIPAGALGPGQPVRPLLLSPNHRVLVESPVVARMTGRPEALVAAKHLIGLNGIARTHEVARITYVHFLLDDHRIVLAEGLRTESLYLGNETRKALGARARAEIFGLFPELKAPAAPPRLALLTGRRAARLVTRSARNGRALAPA